MATKPPTDVSNDPWNEEMLQGLDDELIDHTDEVRRFREREIMRLQTWEQLRDALNTLAVAVAIEHRNDSSWRDILALAQAALEAAKEE